MLRDLSRSYLTIVKDLSRVMNRLKAVYCSWAIPCAGRDVYYTRHRAQWLAKIREAGVRRRAERLYEQLDMLQHLRQQARRELLAESRKHLITAKLRQIPFSGADSNGAGGGTDPDPTSFPHQAAALGLQRFRGRDSRQRRVPLCARQTATQPRAHDGARAECQIQLQQGSEESKGLPSRPALVPPGRTLLASDNPRPEIVPRFLRAPLPALGRAVAWR